jgi:uncharacterized Ntn-hydrolase superfamily protein
MQRYTLNNVKMFKVVTSYRVHVVGSITQSVKNQYQYFDSTVEEHCELVVELDQRFDLKSNRFDERSDFAC